MTKENLETTESIAEETSKVSGDITSDKTVESDSNHEEDESQMSTLENSQEDSNFTSLNEESQDDSKDVPEEKIGRRSKTTWRERHQKREKEKQQTVHASEETEDYVFKTKRQRLFEQENEQAEEVHEEIDDDEEIERQRIEAKERERKQKQYENRLKNIQRLQARSLIQEEAEDDFYKSWHEKEEEERQLKEAEEELEKQRENSLQDDDVSEEGQSKQPKFVEITDKDLPKRDPEEAEKAGVAKWAKMCEPELNAEPPAEVTPATDAVNTTSSSSGTKDLPSKAQVDAQQEEQQTWQDRWYQNKKVQKTVQQSKFNSKVRTQYKKKFKTDEKSADKYVEEAPGTSAKDLKAEALRRKEKRNQMNTQLPIIGSLDEYSKLPKQKEESKDTASKSSDEESDDETDVGDGLWSAILGKK